MQRDLLTSLIETEADTLLAILKTLPLRSLSRLYSSCSRLKHFITRHQAAIRTSLAVCFKIIVCLDQVNLSIAAKNSFKTLIRIKKDYAGEFLEDPVWQATEDLVAHKQDDGGWIISSAAPLDTAMQLLAGPFRDFHIDVLDFCYDFRLNYGDSYPFSVIEDMANSLAQFLIAENRRADKLLWPVVQANPSRVLAFVDKLGVRDLEIVKRGENVNEKWDLSQDFFQEGHALQKFKATGLNCEVRDAELNRFDQLMVTMGRTAITIDAIVAWARRKLQDGRFGDKLLIVLNDADVQEFTRRLLVEFFFSEVKYDDDIPDFRGSTGTWMKLSAKTFSRDMEKKEIALTIMESFASPQVSPGCSRGLFDWPQELVFSLEITISDAVITLVTGNEPPSGEFAFQFSGNRPDDAFFIEKWADEAFVYNLGPQNYLIHVVSEEEEVVSEAIMTKLLRLFGEKLREFKFIKARCDGSNSDKALECLQKIQSGYQGRFAHLSVHGDYGPSEELLIETIQQVQAERFSFAFDDHRPFGEEHLIVEYPPWRLSERFFVETPTLRAFTLRPLHHWDHVKCREIRIKTHFLGVTDETLTRFNKFKAPSALTPITRNGVQNWIKEKFRVDVTFGEDEKVLKCFNPRGKVHAKFVKVPNVEEGTNEKRLLSISFMDATKRGEGGTYIEQEWNSDFMLVRERESSGWDSNEGSWAYHLEERTY